MGGKDGSNMVTIFKRFGDSCGATGSHLTNSEIVKGMITRARAKITFLVETRDSGRSREVSFARARVITRPTISVISERLLIV